MTGPRVLVFDVNETLLDLGALDRDFARVFGTRLSAVYGLHNSFKTPWFRL